MRSEIVRSFVMLSLVTLGGCYRPALNDCRISCSDDNGCPETMSCNQNLCAHAGTFCSNLDMALAPDMETPLAAPRLIAPLSTATVTQQRPTLRWISPSGNNLTMDVQLCTDRHCKVPLKIMADVLPDQQSARPRTALPSGWVFWRVAATNGQQTSYSATWQLWVGKASASTTVDTSSGSILDVNGDGLADFLIGSPGDKNIGIAHLYLGNASGVNFQRIDITNPDGYGAGFGYNLSSAGDVNGDGFADFLVRSNTAGAAGSGVQYEGAVHLFLGGPNPNAADWNGPGAPKRIDIESPDGHDNYFGVPVPLGDVNGDGYADFLIGPWLAEKAHLYLGGPTPSGTDWNGLMGAPKRIDLTNQDDPHSWFGHVQRAGDVNGDGYADFMVTAPIAANHAGAAHLYLGGPNTSSNDWNASTSTTRIDLINLDGPGAAFGSCLDAGDFNGDGYSDLVIGSPTPSTGGAVHLYLGGATPSAADWNAASPTARIDMPNPDGGNAIYGCDLATAGDVNGDGFDDFLVGAYGAGAGGLAHLYLGYANITPGPMGFVGQRIDLISPDSAGGVFGSTMSGAGDVDGDGIPDFLIAAPKAGANGAHNGAVHLYLGGTGASGEWNKAFGATMNRVDYPDPDDSNTQFGQSVAKGTTKAGGLRAPGRRRK